MTYEYEYDGNTTLYVKFRHIDDSFDHEHGVETNAFVEVESIRIVTMFDGVDLDLTEYFVTKPDLLRMFTEFAVEKYQEEESNE